MLVRDAKESSLKVLVGFVCMEVSQRHGCTLSRLACSDDQAIGDCAQESSACTEVLKSGPHGKLSALWHLRVATCIRTGHVWGGH